MTAAELTLHFPAPKLAQVGDDLPILNVYQYHDGRFYSAESADVQAGLGLWVYVAEGAEISVQGLPVGASVSIPLAPGWNAVGNPFDSEIPWGDNVTLSCAEVTYTLSQAVSAGVTDGKLYEYSGVGYVQAGAIAPWKGYFIKANKACVLVLRP